MAPHPPAVSASFARAPVVGSVAGMAMELRDSHGRVMRDLRVSVTDRCNFRCLYCLPET